MDYGIDVWNKVNDGNAAQATYIFAASKESSYFSSFLSSDHLFNNHIPPQSYGIPSPSSQYNSFELQFCKETFSANKAVLQKPLRYAEDSSARKTILSSSQLGNLDLKKIDQSAGGTLLYFEQGLIVGLASAAVTASACSYFAFQGFKDLLRSLRGLIGLLRYLSLDFGVL